MQQVCGGDEDVIGNIYISATGEEEDMVGWLGSVKNLVAVAYGRVISKLLLTGLRRPQS
jgi:hypothetical protein